MTSGPADVDAHIAALPVARRGAMHAIRAAIREAAPNAGEGIAYGMPAFRDPTGRFLVSYAAFKAHASLFPASGAVVAALGAELDPFLAGKGTLRFPSDAPIPVDLVRRVVAVRLEELAAGSR